MIKVTSPAFQNGETIPDKYSAYHENISPPLQWTGIPKEAKSIALIVDDPDAPGATPFSHWVVYNISTSSTGFAEGKHEGIEGKNGRGVIGYFGPRPPSGTHHYHFKVYALDDTLHLPAGADRETALKEMDKHVVSQEELIGLYSH